MSERRPDGDGAATPTSPPLPTTMGRVAPRALALAGYTDLRDISRATARELQAIHGVGPKAIRSLREALAEAGLGFRDEPPAG